MATEHGSETAQQFPTGAPLAEEVLARARTLPLKPDPVVLTGRRVRLEPLDLARDVEPLFAVSNGRPATLGARRLEAYDADQLIWRYLFGGPFQAAEGLASYLRGQIEAIDGRCFCVFDTASGQQVGVVNYLNNVPVHLKVELGSIWYSPLVQRSLANTEATYLLLRHAFARGYRRLEWKCDALNARSRRAALRIGFQFEGIQEQHFIIKGRNRDTAWYRIVDHEWPRVAQALEATLDAGY